MIYKYLQSIETESLMGVYLKAPSYDPSLYSLGEANEEEGFAMFGTIFSDYMPKTEENDLI